MNEMVGYESPTTSLGLAKQMTVSARLKSEKQALEERLQRINKTIKLLDKTPEVREIIDELRQLGI